MEWRKRRLGRKETKMDAADLHTLGDPPRREQFPEPIAGDSEVIVHPVCDTRAHYAP